MKLDNHKLCIFNVSVTKGIYCRFLPDSEGNKVKYITVLSRVYMHVHYLN